ncbi:hypothetical protein Pla175_04190 [Pirellulimonas nuda]|uniref:Uncharacterized protein n=1 Tax=Pirellulimonas nuda TaxID=2528009 RepID=A0A518D6F3_9BACT|nr:hypothetical protein [Pirellulimonas nuda]QDU87064.1 hypothetical protein Pla175_04190 [Pirellulimonas nuda]
MPTVPVRCLACGARGQAPASMVGQSAPCPKCGGQISVTPPPRRLAPSTQIGVNCRLCDTRMYADARHVGRKIKCPDCGTLTVIQPPKPVAKPARPAALDATDGYQVWTEERQPWAAELVAAQPKRLAVVCTSCQSLLYATPEQVGQELVCGDCGVSNLVRPPVAKPLAPAPDEGPDFELEVEDAHDQAEQRRLAEQYLAEGAQRVAVEKHASVVCPPMPRQPLLTGVFSFFNRAMFVRWVALSTSLAVTLGLGAVAVVLLDGVGGGEVEIAANAVFGVCLGVGVVMIGALTLGYLCCLLLMIVAESSEGNRELYGAVSPNPPEWLGETVCVVTACLAAGIPGALASLACPDDPIVRTAVVLIGAALALPVIVLSQLAASSAWALFLPSIPRAMAAHAVTTLLFYLQSLLIGAAAAGGFAALIALGPLVAIPLGPLLAWLALVYARLLGRLGWRLAE